MNVFLCLRPSLKLGLREISFSFSGDSTATPPIIEIWLLSWTFFICLCRLFLHQSVLTLSRTSSFEFTCSPRKWCSVPFQTPFKCQFYSIKRSFPEGLWVVRKGGGVECRFWLPSRKFSKSKRSKNQPKFNFVGKVHWMSILTHHFEYRLLNNQTVKFPLTAKAYTLSSALGTKIEQNQRNWLSSIRFLTVHPDNHFSWLLYQKQQMLF